MDGKIDFNCINNADFEEVCVKALMDRNNNWAKGVAMSKDQAEQMVRENPEFWVYLYAEIKGVA